MKKHLCDLSNQIKISLLNYLSGHVDFIINLS
jgi:hypothetical protein